MIENADEIFEVIGRCFGCHHSCLFALLFVFVYFEQVPPEVQVVADRYFKKLTKRRDKMSASMASGDFVDGMAKESAAESEDGDGELVIDVYSTSCKRQCVDNYHETGREQAMDEVAKLYELVKSMPDGPQKTHFMKRVRPL